MIIEFFGLSNSGKSALKKEIDRKRYNVLKFENVNPLRKIVCLLFFMLKNPVKSCFLFFKLNSNYVGFEGSNTRKFLKIIKQRNSYLASVLSKYEIIKNFEGSIFVDEFFFQSIFMILQRNSSEKEIARVIKEFSLSPYLFLFEGDRKRRYEAYKKPHPYKPNATLMPGSWIDKNYAEEWMKTMEFNFNLIRKFIEENYKRNKDKFKRIAPVYPEVYELKNEFQN